VGGALTLKQEKGRRRKERMKKVEMSGLYSARLLTHKYSSAETAINNL
jgi:uncharacterized protein Veg